MRRRQPRRSIDVLGPLQVTENGKAVPLRPAQRRLLSILTLDPGKTLSSELLIDRMWGEAPPATARTALHVHASGLRRAFPDMLVTTGTGYRVKGSADRSDRAAFERLVTQARRHAQSEAWPHALKAAERGLAIWRGEPFAELRYDAFAVPEVERLNELWAELTELHASALVRDGRPDDAVARLRKLTALHPLRESLWEQLMVALHQSGRRAEALRAFQEARRVLGEELGTEPGPSLRLMEERIAVDDPLLGSQPAALPAHSLPATPTSFVGRERELAELEGILGRGQVVTIVGGPGFGKTRLAIEAGREALERRGHRIWFVALAEARSEQDVIGAIATAADLKGQVASMADLAERLRPRDELLVLDNCEHVLAGCASFVRAVLAGPGKLKVLSTSRRPLGVRHERVWRIHPLAVPRRTGSGRAGDPSATSVLASPAVRLFADRARSVDRGYRMTPQVTQAVAQLCRLTDGIPLALELAASWVRALALDDIRDMLGIAMRTTTGADQPAHHRSLRATIEWSMALLPPGDRRLFMAASIFKGTFQLADAAAVCTAHVDRRTVAAAIARLVDASLIVAERRDDGSVHYRTLIPIREFGQEAQAQRTESGAIRDRFVTHYLRKAREHQRDPFAEVVDLAAVDDDLDNFRGAFEIGVSLGRFDEVARALVPLDMYWRNRYLGWEGRAWLSRVLPHVTDPGVRAGALASAALQAQVTNDLDEALRQFGEAIATYRQLDDGVGLQRCLLALSGLHCNRGDWAAGLETAREGRRLASASGHGSALAIAAHYVGKNLVGAGQVAEGIQDLAEAARLARDAGEASRASHYASTVTHVAVLSGDERAARQWADEGVALARAAGSSVRLARALGASAALEARWGDPEMARTSLMQVAGLLAHHEGNEHLFEFLFPAGMLLRRCQRWGLLFELVQAVEAVLATTSQGYGAPWEMTARAWRRESSEAIGAPTGRQSHRSADAVMGDVLRVL